MPKTSSHRTRPRKSKRRRRTIKMYDPIVLIRACFPRIREVAPIPRQSGYYVTDDGRVVSLARAEPRIRTHHVTKDGRVMVRTASRAYSAARLVLEVFGGGARSRKFLADHINGIVHDNRIENLRWITNSQWKKDVAHPAQRVRASMVSSRTAVARIRHRYRDARRLLPVDGFPTYFVDDDGRIYSLWGMEARRLVARHARHTPVSLRRPDGATRQRSWGSIVATAFVGPRPSAGHYVLHLDGDASNFRASNLAWQKRGPVPNKPRFGPNEVRAIRFLRKKGEASARIGAVFGCSDTAVDDIAARRAYAHVPSSSADPMRSLPPRLVSRIHRATRFGATLAPAVYVAHQIARIREAFPDAGALRQVVGYVDYFVSSNGRVYSTQRGRVRRLSVTKGCVGLVGDRSRQVSLKALVAATFANQYR
jgi:hypothetical protein